MEVALQVTVLSRFEVHPANCMWLSTLDSYASFQFTTFSVMSWYTYYCTTITIKSLLCNGFSRAQSTLRCQRKIRS